jgi:molybdopterin-guanine dinucleotide biosynthesis protein A
MRAAGFVLVGGHSVRMGRDKARLSTASGLLLENVAARVLEAAGSVALVGQPERYADLPFDRLADARPGLGPLAGLEAALASRRGDLNLVLACDMPDLPLPWLERLLATARESEDLCVIARDSAGRLHPLCGVYKTACLPLVREALDEGRLRLLDLVANLRAAEIAVPGTIGNLNTPEQWAGWQTRRSA